jgi:predicted AAA+ superfamily ATPase
MRPKQWHQANRLIFLAADHGVLSRLRDAARVALAWASIVNKDVKEGRLNIDLLQMTQAENDLQSAEEVLPRVARECYKWLLGPAQEVPTDLKPSVEALLLNTSGGSAGSEIERVCLENELVIRTWSPVHLRTKFKELYWKEGQLAVKAMTFWEDTLRYLYLPRLRNRALRTRSATARPVVISSARLMDRVATPSRGSSLAMPASSSMTRCY